MLFRSNRWETYAIKGTRGSGVIELNGAVAHLGAVGDLLTIMAFAGVDATLSDRWKPKVIVLGTNNTVASDTDR